MFVFRVGGGGVAWLVSNVLKLAFNRFVKTELVLPSEEPVNSVGVVEGRVDPGVAVEDSVASGVVVGSDVIVESSVVSVVAIEEEEEDGV